MVVKKLGTSPSIVSMGKPEISLQLRSSCRAFGVYEIHILKGNMCSTKKLLNSSKATEPAIEGFRG